MKTIRIGGVPEHFNMPWYYALEKGMFEQQGVHVEWYDFPGGTGAMNKALREESLDVAVILTEGIVADIIKGNKCKLLAWYVKSPLLWGIHVADSSSIITTEQLEGNRYAISRFGSGSHLMAHVDAFQRGYTLDEQQFVVVNNLNGGINALQNREADIFMWEKFMTQPYVDQKILRRVGVCPTPWPSFVLAVRENVINEHESVILKIQSVVQEACRQFYNLPDAVSLISKKFTLKEEEVKEWMTSVEWENQTKFDTSYLKEVMEMLYKLKIIDTLKPVEELVYKVNQQSNT